MPFLNWNRGTRGEQPRRSAAHPAAGGRAPVEILPAHHELTAEAHTRARLFDSCANPRCSAARIRLWRGRRAAFFEGRWHCSSACLRAQLESAFSREMHLRSSGADGHRHRVPLGLAMLEQGWITALQLREALDAQRAAGAGRLGQWLVRQRATSEELVTRALGLQWSSPVLSAEHHDAEAMTALVPRLFVDAFGVLPLRVAGGRLLYLGFEDRPDPVLAHAIERMTGLRVESGLVRGSVFRPAREQMLAARYPRAGLIEASSESTLLDALLKTLDQAHPVDARLVRVHDCLWLRLQKRHSFDRDAVEDLIGSVTGA